MGTAVFVRYKAAFFNGRTSILRTIKSVSTQRRSVVVSISMERALDDLPPGPLAGLNQASMSTEQLSLVAVCALFLLVLLWRVRPALPLTRPRDREALRVVQEKIANAKGPEARAQALCEAGELCAQRGRRVGAEGFFRRALAEQPSAQSVQRAATALSKWPRTAEAVLWKALASAKEPTSEREVLAALVGVLEQGRSKRTQAEALRKVLGRLPA
jgi:hypothetical protein